MNCRSDFVDCASRFGGGRVSAGGMMHGYDNSTMQFRNARQCGAFSADLKEPLLTQRKSLYSVEIIRPSGTAGDVAGGSGGAFEDREARLIVAEHDHFALASLQTGANSGVAAARDPMAEQPDLGIVASQVVGDLARGVGRAVVDDQNLKPITGIGHHVEDFMYGAAERSLGVLDGQQDRERT
jgi:hypothetical protein